jgi:hypothetical protein
VLLQLRLTDSLNSFVHRFSLDIASLAISKLPLAPQCCSPLTIDGTRLATCLKYGPRRQHHLCNPSHFFPPMFL